MNASEYFLVSKMVEHLNVINQYARILHEGTYDQIFKADDGHDLTVELDEAREKMLSALEGDGNPQMARIAAEIDLATAIAPFISVPELAEIISNAKGLEA